MSTNIATILSVRDHIETVLGEATGLSQKDRRIIAYWIIATHDLHNVRQFPILRALGKMACGKSQTLRVIAAYSREAKKMSLRAMTQAAFRDSLCDAYEGTAIIEEADSVWKGGEWFETFISDRYSRETSVGAVKEQLDKSVWKATPTQKLYFGATVIHRRVPFADAALDGRTITINFKPVKRDAPFIEFDSENDRSRKISDSAKSFALPLNHYQLPTTIPGRIANTWRPILAVAHAVNDQNFIENIVALHVATAALELKEAQDSEPDAVVLKAIIREVFKDSMEGSTPVFKNIKLSELVISIKLEDQQDLKSRQVGQLARQLGFEVGVSHGQSVVKPDRASLLRVCQDQQYSDPEIDRLRLETLRSVLPPPNVLESIRSLKESAKENTRE
jgi:hypothetical protein